MNQLPGKLGIREYVSIAILMVGSKATEDTPAVLFTKDQNAAWMIPILSAGIFFIPFFLLLKTLSLFQGKNLFFIIQKLLGKYIGFFVCLVIFIITSAGISFDSRTYTNIIRAFYFRTTPILILYALLMAVCAYGAKKGIQHIGSVAYLLILYAIIGLFVALGLSTQDSNVQAMLPIWGPGKMEIIRQSSQSLTLFADFFLLTMLIPYLTSYKEFRKGTWIAYIYVSIQISVATLLFICMLDHMLGGVGYPFHTAIRYISLGSYIPNIEIIFFIIWIMSAFIRFTAFLYISVQMFGHIFKIKDFEFLIPSLATLYLLIGIIPESPIELGIEWEKMVQTVAGPAFAAISLILWLSALLKGEFKHAKDQNSR
ncbi:GerAB/ArcD/ProY family transporter [Neobacillus sp. MM2021_6]|uniref:GerAB/ArcD/ProY family transporter n=1 Tax=Bacillaceae TaxID=186817 RepID=UPI00140D00FF|nr:MULTISPECIES: GerAB/ArcD/ProY family transporter [Bacillaceae]MBO0961380.1 GerAB/ArcD/ProY family transporter [Neobacillus sp. MM2021_6]NHC20549.1 GerAB/ArcD/ProY family transporter [Bacillus sp. MM2020_4]